MERQNNARLDLRDNYNLQLVLLLGKSSNQYQNKEILLFQNENPVSLQSGQIFLTKKGTLCNYKMDKCINEK